MQRSTFSINSNLDIDNLFQSIVVTLPVFHTTCVAARVHQGQTFLC